MRAGRLDRFITLQSKSTTPSSSGAPVESWAIHERRRPASISPVRGDERFSTPQTVATEQVEFWIRHSASVAGLQPNLHRIIYPALETGEDANVAKNRIFDILAVHEIGRREGLKIVAERHPDVTT